KQSHGQGRQGCHLLRHIFFSPRGSFPIRPKARGSVGATQVSDQSFLRLQISEKKASRSEFSIFSTPPEAYYRAPARPVYARLCARPQESTQDVQNSADLRSCQRMQAAILSKLPCPRGRIRASEEAAWRL